MKKRIIVSVISDIVTDQRVQKECRTLYNIGYDVVLLGRKSDRDFGLSGLPYRVKRFAVPFSRGPMMYLFFNLRLFFYLLFKRAGVLWSNDLDTLLPNFLASKLKGQKLVYDSHEYFTFSVYKKRSRKIWERLEKYLFPRLKNVITVNDSLKNIYEAKYKLPVTVIRNVPLLQPAGNENQVLFPAGRKILIIQGMGINEHRGAEEAVVMMQYLPEDFQLYFVGGGTIWKKLKQRVISMHLTDKVFFISSLPYNDMMKYTRASFLGLILEKTGVSDHHLYALPNKFFDYLQARIPVLSSKVVEVEKLIDKYDVGAVVDETDPEQIAKSILDIASDAATYNRWKLNTARAAEELNWEREEKILVDFMQALK
ncbi:MAG TPA: glycosyltransferase [Chitinophagaceae bacterium]|nr:glycosyltransferase [Chitinophagaceae bacterium]